VASAAPPPTPAPSASAGPHRPADCPVARPAADSRPATSRSEDSVAADAAAPALPDSPAPCQQPTQPRSQYPSPTNARAARAPRTRTPKSSGTARLAGCSPVAATAVGLGVLTFATPAAFGF